jgi:hypothetical protein
MGDDINLDLSSVRTSPMMAPINQYGSSAITTLTNPEDVLTQLELSYKSIVVDRDGREVVCGEPLMNQLGVNSVVTQVRAIVNQATVMSNLTDENIRLLTDFMADTLARDLMTNRRRYGIKAAYDRDKIFTTAVEAGLIVMKRAREQGERNFWRGSVQELIHKLQNPDGGGKKFSLNPFAKH